MELVEYESLANTIKKKKKKKERKQNRCLDCCTCKAKSFHPSQSALSVTLTKIDKALHQKFKVLSRQEVISGISLGVMLTQFKSSRAVTLTI